MKSSYFGLSVLVAILVIVVGLNFLPKPQVELAAQSKCILRAGALPDPKCTPGALNPDISQANIKKNICAPAGTWSTSSIRPSVSYTNKLKTQGIIDYGYSQTNPSLYEEDHLISLQLGGSPTDPRNLWPEPYSGPLGARIKDVVESYLKRQVCAGKLTLADAQKQIRTDWTAVYKTTHNTLGSLEVTITTDEDDD